MSDLVPHMPESSPGHPLGQDPASPRVVDFVRDGKRIVAFLEDDTAPGTRAHPWPQVAEVYARTQGIGLSDAYWYDVYPRRFANGRPDISRYVGGDQPWRFETNLALVREIVQRLGFDPDSLPLDL